VVQAITPFPGDSFFLYMTRLLENAELAEPAYRARHGIETRVVPHASGFVDEREEIVVATNALPVDAWRAAFGFGYLLAALWNQRLLQTTLHVLRFALGADLAAFVDALLASEQPRLAAVRAELERFSAAILDGVAATLPVDGFGAARREPVEAVCARVLEDAAGFYAEVAGEAAAFGAELRDAVAWDALQLLGGSAGFAHDWIDYAARMGSCPQPEPRPIRVRARAVPLPPAPERRLEAFLALGWAKQPRVSVERVADALEPVPRAQLEARARADGCAYLPRLLPAARLDALRAVVDRALARRAWRVDGRSDPALRLGGWEDARWIDFLGEVAGSAAYRELAAAPEILEVMRVLVGGEPEVHVGDVCRLVSPGALDLTTPPHQDAAYLKQADGVWTAWLPVETCPRALGPLAVLPGSHTGGLRPHATVMRGGPVVGLDIPDDAPWRSADLEVGDAIVFSSLTVHKALPNLTRDRLRVSVDFRYRRARTGKGDTVGPERSPP
jgi:hypothetical protein